MALNWEFTGGATPLDEDEKLGLITDWVTTRSQLDEVEQYNIEKGEQWALGLNRKPDDLLGEAFVKRLHNEMYKEVWKWAGEFRTTEKNIGIDPIRIPVELRQLLDDARYWVAHATYPADELAIRVKHRIVSIHCFPNGNGRHSRLLADVLVSSLGRPLFTWGAHMEMPDVRERYLSALRKADRGNMVPLIAFARS